MDQDKRNQFLAYVVAVMGVAAAVLLRWFFDMVLNGDHALPTLFGAVAFAVWYGGFAPALFASVLGYLAVDYLFIEPRGVIGAHSDSDFVGFLFYFSSCLIIIGFGSGMRAAQRRAMGSMLDALAKKKELEQEMLQRKLAQDALKEADQRKNEFLATLAHELRNPLAPIRNALHVLRLAGTSKEALVTMLDMMDRQVRHMVRLIDDLLDISRITRGTIELRKEGLDMAEVVQAALETSRPLIEAEKHELTVALAPQSLFVVCDKVRLAQALGNLLNNSAKYTPRGGHIWLTMGSQQGHAIVTVRDNGIGIPTMMLPSIFDMFVQIDQHPERSRGGLGIGLCLVRRLIELHGGTIEAHSDGLGQGSEFIVRLPVAMDMLGPQPSAGPDKEAAFGDHRLLAPVP
jgi:signal transduction histidine kinase